MLQIGELIAEGILLPFRIAFGLCLALDRLLLKLRWRKAKFLSHRNEA